MRRQFLLFLIALGAAVTVTAQKTRSYVLHSPDGNLEIRVDAGPSLTWAVDMKQEPVIIPSPLSMQLYSGSVWGRNMRIRSGKIRNTSEEITPPFYKKDIIHNDYNELVIQTRDGYSVEFRAYNEGGAYRFVGTTPGEIKVKSEEARFRLAGDFLGYFPFVNNPHFRDPFQCSFENIYRHIKISQFRDTLAFAPVLIELPGGRKAVITEADLEEYPGMFLEADKEGDGLAGRFAPYPLKEERGGHNNIQIFVRQRTDYLAQTSGTRSFPWRIVVVSGNDRELLNSDMVYKLASPSRLGETSWIRPGKVAWDWWNDWNISHVNFRAGINTDTYKYYIDFASKYGIEYVLLDEGWADHDDIFKIIPEINLPELIQYASARHVGVWLWCGWAPLNDRMEEAVSLYSKMGIKGLKVDFMDRDDQKAVEFYYRLAKTAAEHHLMIDFHGAYKPTGLHRTYPNVVNIEGVHGMEQEKWSNRDFPLYDVSIPFIRMLAGPMDYTPGAMRNANKQDFRPIYNNPMSQGTRCHQLAMYVIYEAPFEMLADNPTAYMQEPESVAFIAGTPTTFDETVALDGQVAEYAAIARRKGREWWAGAITNWTPRDLQIDCSFLKSGNYEVEIIKDGINADREATDYAKDTLHVTAADKISVHLAPGGGWVAHFKPLP